jgi:hypothetical protein
MGFDKRHLAGRPSRPFRRTPIFGCCRSLDRAGRPAGAIFEKDIRRLLLNPFGHALLRNPYYNHNFEEHVRTCPIMELSSDVGALVDHYRRRDGREGMILTVGGPALCNADQPPPADACRRARA